MEGPQGGAGLALTAPPVNCRGFSLALSPFPLPGPYTQKGSYLKVRPGPVGTGCCYCPSRVTVLNIQRAALGPVAGVGHTGRRGHTVLTQLTMPVTGGSPGLTVKLCPLRSTLCV